MVLAIISKAGAPWFIVVLTPLIVGFLCGLINDVVLSLNLGISPLSYLFVSLVAAYIRTATVRSTLISDWFTFVIAIMGGNFITFILIKNFSNVGVNYTDFFYNSLFTFILYPAFWGIFELYKRGISLRVYD